MTRCVCLEASRGRVAAVVVALGVVAEPAAAWPWRAGSWPPTPSAPWAGDRRRRGSPSARRSRGPPRSRAERASSAGSGGRCAACGMPSRHSGASASRSGSADWQRRGRRSRGARRLGRRRVARAVVRAVATAGGGRGGPAGRRAGSSMPSSAALEVAAAARAAQAVDGARGTVPGSRTRVDAPQASWRAATTGPAPGGRLGKSPVCGVSGSRSAPQVSHRERGDLERRRGPPRPGRASHTPI